MNYFLKYLINIHSEEEFKEKVEKSEGLLIVDFYAEYNIIKYLCKCLDNIYFLKIILIKKLVPSMQKIWTYFGIIS